MRRDSDLVGERHHQTSKVDFQAQTGVTKFAYWFLDEVLMGCNSMKNNSEGIGLTARSFHREVELVLIVIACSIRALW